MKNLTVRDSRLAANFCHSLSDDPHTPKDLYISHTPKDL